MKPKAITAKSARNVEGKWSALILTAKATGAIYAESAGMPHGLAINALMGRGCIADGKKKMQEGYPVGL